MSSKFFGNRTEKHSLNKKGGKQKFNNKSNKAKSAGAVSYTHLTLPTKA